mgnify:CR=1 FL=1
MAIAAIGLAMAGCQASSDTAPADAAAEPAGLSKLDYSLGGVVHHDDGARVEVRLDAAWRDDSVLVIRGVFTPDDQGYHLYGADLPREGVSGIGRPTLLEVDDAEDYAAASSVISDKTAKTHVDETLGISVPLFPDGPVTLYLPVEFASPPTEPVAIPVKLTYMACSDQRCHMPVVDAEQTLTVDPQ